MRSLVMGAAGVFLPSVTGKTHAVPLLDVERNLSALAVLRSFTMNCENCDSTQFRNLSLLASLPHLKLFCASNIRDGNAYALWIERCVELQYLLCTSWSNLTNLDAIARAPSLRSLFLNDCSSITDIAPLHGAATLECLLIKDCPNITTYEPLLRMVFLRTLVVDGEAFG